MPFALKVPFRLSQGQKFDVLPFESAWGDQRLKIVRDERGDLGARIGYYLIVSGFSSLADAEQRFHALREAFDWASLKLAAGFDSDSELQSVVLAPDPEEAAMNLGLKAPIDGLVSKGPHIVEDGKSVGVFEFGQLSVHVQRSTGEFAAHMIEAMARGLATGVDERLRTALDLYRAHFSETSQAAQFLTLIMCLEALAEPTPKPDSVQRLMDGWHKEATELKAKSTGDEKASCEALLNELSFRRGSSVSSNIRLAVRSALETVNDPKAEDAAREATALYHHRSVLLHEGKIEKADLCSSVEQTRSLVQRVLKARLVGKE